MEWKMSCAARLGCALPLFLLLALCSQSNASNQRQNDSGTSVHAHFDLSKELPQYRTLLDTAEVPVSDEAVIGLGEFVKESGIHWRVKWNSKTGGIDVLRHPSLGNKTYRVQGVTQLDRAVTFIEDHQSLIWPSDRISKQLPHEILPVRIAKDGNGIEFAHKVGGLYVYGSRATIRMTSNGGLHKVEFDLAGC